MGEIVQRVAVAPKHQIFICKLSRQFGLEAWRRDVEAVSIEDCGGQAENLCPCGIEIKENKIQMLKLVDEVLESVILLPILNLTLAYLPHCGQAR